MVFKPLNRSEIDDAIGLYCSDKKKAIKQYGVINDWDVSLINDMSNLFYERINFNEPIENWDVGNVIDMSFMFYSCRNFNQPLNNWNVGNVLDMNSMFLSCYNFNHPLIIGM